MTCSHGIIVFVFRFTDAARTEDKDEFLKELAIHTLIEPHENVIELLGCCIRDGELQNYCMMSICLSLCVFV